MITMVFSYGWNRYNRSLYVICDCMLLRLKSRCSGAEFLCWYYCGWCWWQQLIFLNFLDIIIYNFTLLIWILDRIISNLALFNTPVIYFISLYFHYFIMSLVLEGFHFWHSFMAELAAISWSLLTHVNIERHNSYRELSSFCLLEMALLFDILLLQIILFTRRSSQARVDHSSNRKWKPSVKTSCLICWRSKKDYHLPDNFAALWK